MRSRTCWIVAGAALVAAAGCAKDTTAPASAALAADVALVTTDGDMQTLQIMHDAAIPGAGFPGLGAPGLLLSPLGGHGGCGPQHRSGATCSGRANGLDVSRTVTFYDASGAEQAAYDSLTTASIRLQTSVSGTVARGPWSATVDRESDVTVSGLAGQETTATWNGTGTSTITRSRHTDGGAARTYDMTGSTTVADLVAPRPHTSGAWPLSGTITHHVTVTQTEGPNAGTTREVDVVVTFDGTQYATVTVNGHTFTLDLAQHRLGLPGVGGVGGPRH